MPPVLGGLMLNQEKFFPQMQTVPILTSTKKLTNQFTTTIGNVWSCYDIALLKSRSPKTLVWQTKISSVPTSTYTLADGSWLAFSHCTRNTSARVYYADQTGAKTWENSEKSLRPLSRMYSQHAEISAKGENGVLVASYLKYPHRIKRELLAWDDGKRYWKEKVML
eukprot:TRINITY_DN2550_c0_g1_i3.p1 TRINITY_DN2550_c0_g1~~TRINITY_DN2550_c0_g1_i3.p1  ORF type:complete len:166 (-),score=17.88 TRINITY_DN2550_c0_g1_i3:15-512(-)